MSTLDPAALQQLCELIGGDRDALRELVVMFLEEGAEIVAEMRDSLAARDSDVLRRGAHSMKSSAQDFGAGELASRSASLEASATNGWPQAADADVAALSRAFATARDELQAWLDSDLTRQDS